MGAMAESLALYAQPLVEDGDGSREHVQRAYSIAQMCWNLALLPKDAQAKSISEMQSVLNMDDSLFEDFRHSVIEPMIVRHQELFPSLSNRTAEKPRIIRSERKYHGTGRNQACPCNSGKKYKRCCGR